MAVTVVQEKIKVINGIYSLILASILVIYSHFV
jgi:hypothetical protein